VARLDDQVWPVSGLLAFATVILVLAGGLIFVAWLTEKLEK